MPSHTRTDPKNKKAAPSWMQEWHVDGNEDADVLAETAAEFHAIPVHKAQTILDVL